MCKWQANTLGWKICIVVSSGGDSTQAGQHMPQNVKITSLLSQITSFGQRLRRGKLEGTRILPGADVAGRSMPVLCRLRLTLSDVRVSFLEHAQGTWVITVALFMHIVELSNKFQIRFFFFHLESELLSLTALKLLREINLPNCILKGNYITYPSKLRMITAFNNFVGFSVSSLCMGSSEIFYWQEM